MITKSTKRLTWANVTKWLPNPPLAATTRDHQTVVGGHGSWSGYRTIPSCFSLFHSRLCPSTAWNNPPPESYNFLCPLLLLTALFLVAPPCLPTDHTPFTICQSVPLLVRMLSSFGRCAQLISISHLWRVQLCLSHWFFVECFGLSLLIWRLAVSFSLLVGSFRASSRLLLLDTMFGDRSGSAHLRLLLR